MKVYYFGCIDDSGHYLWDKERPPQPTMAERIMGPGAERLNGHNRGNAWRSRETRELYRNGQPWKDSIDSMLCPSGPQVEGVALLHHKDGWTAVAFWDRTVDHRPGSHSTFIAEGTFTYDEMVTAAKTQWPEVWARYKFEVREADQ
jgi:hypothetical protein